MTPIPIPILTVIEQHENGQLLARPLLFPEISCLGDNRKKVLAQVEDRVRELIVELEEAERIYRRVFRGDVQCDVARVTVEPPKRTTAWRRKLEIPLHVVRWRHGQEASIAFVPALGIEVIAEDDDQLVERTRRHIKQALQRSGIGGALEPLLRLTRAAEITTAPSRAAVSLPTPKQRNQGKQQRELDEKSTLSQVADELSKQRLPRAYEVTGLVDQLVERLTPPRRESVLLVGPSGVGKTALVAELVRSRAAPDLKVWATSGSRIVAGMSGFGMWQERCGKLIKDLKRVGGVLHVGSLVELIEVGKSEGNDEGIAGYLRPAVARGELTIVAECTPEQLAIVERRAPTLIEALRQIKVPEPNRRQAESILLSCALEGAAGNETPISIEALESLDRLHRRFATYSAFPGRPLRFLRNLLATRADQVGAGEANAAPVDERDVLAAFCEETGLPRFLLDDDEPLDLDEAADWFTRRIIAQEEPVRLILDLLASVKAGLSRRGRPIASLLFIGPTGVGKTETAKALAEFLYHDPKRMVRIDMSEYADPFSIDRLIGGTYATEGLLTGRIRQQPFSVVLLDEFEKAHDSFFDLLLQVLGEGRLTDSVGRVADFTNAVVIMTSNLGARSFQRASLGFTDVRHTAGGAREHFEREVRQTVRPELFNRIDRIVPFLPLDREAAARIARRTIELLRGRDGLSYRDLTFACDDESVLRLAERGYSAVYGARPLVRAVERAVVAPLAHRLNTYAGDLPLAAVVHSNGANDTEESGAAADHDGAEHDSVEHEDVDSGRPADNGAPAQLLIEVRPAVDTQTRLRSRQDDRTALLRCAESVVETRRRSQAVESSAAFLSLKNEHYQLEQLERRLAKRKARGRPRTYDHTSRMTHLGRLVTSIAEMSARAAALEDEVLTVFHGPGEAAAEVLSGWGEKLAAIDGQLLESARMLMRHRYASPDRATLVLFGLRPERIAQLGRAYVDIAQARKSNVAAHVLLRHRDAPSRPPPGRLKVPLAKETEEQVEVEVLDALPVRDLPAWLDAPHERAFGLALQVEGVDAFPLLEDERGLHVLHDHGKVTSCLVVVDEKPLKQFLAPAGVTRQGAIGTKPPRRSYHLDSRTLREDSGHEQPFVELGETLRQWLEARLKEKAWRAIDQWK